MSQVSTFNYDFCFICEDTQEVLGHSSIDCPEVNCVKCFDKGHYAGKCPNAKPQESETQGSETQGSETQGSETEGSKTIMALGSPRQPIELWKVDNDIDLDSIELMESDLGSDGISIGTQRSESLVSNYDQPELWKIDNDNDLDSTEMIDSDLGSDKIPIGTQRSESQISNYI